MSCHPLYPHEPVYKGELAVGVISSVNVGQGSTVTSDIADTYDNVSCRDRPMLALIRTAPCLERRCDLANRRV